MEILQLSPKLKSSLQFGAQRHDGDVSCLVENLVEEKFWRLGADEFRFIRRLDGQKTVEQHLSDLKSENLEFEPEEAQQMVSWLAHEGLLENMSGQGEPSSEQKLLKSLNQSVFLRLRLGNPQPLLEWLYPIFGFLTHPIFFLPWLATLVLAGIIIGGQWTEFQNATLNVVTPNNWLQFLLIWWGLKAVHELFHGLTCLRHGGNVREAGVLFILFAPLGAYVDVTSAWRFDTKWKRLHVTLAGIYVELLIAALAIIAWSMSTDPILRQIYLQIFVMATVATLLFNGNPLIRFDGYYFLSDLIEIPNLYQQGQISVRRFVSKLFFGDVGRLPPVHSRKKFFVFGYGVAAFFYRLLLNVSIILAAAVLLEGPGLILAVALTASWLLWPLLKEIGRVLWYSCKNPLRGVRGLVLFSMLVTGLTWSATQVELPISIVMPGVVHPVVKTQIRSESNGILKRVDVKPGERVKKGQLLAVIDNPELAISLISKETQLKRNEMAIRQYTVDGDLAARQAEMDVVASLQRQVDLLKKEQARLEVRAPHDGMVMDFDLEHLWGKQLKKGAPLFFIGDLSQFEFDFSLGQGQIESFEKAEGDWSGIQVFIPGHPPIETDFGEVRVNPRADWELRDAALAAVNGGPLPVTQVNLPNGRVDIRTTEPRWQGIVNLPPTVEVFPGTVGRMRATVRQTTFVGLLRPWFDASIQYVTDKLQGLRP